MSRLEALGNQLVEFHLWPRLRLPRYCVRRWRGQFPQLAVLGSGGVWQ
jgi:hypothetical protein